MDSYNRLKSSSELMGYVREWYEKLFNEFPPWDKYHIELIILKISYELLKRDYQTLKLDVPKKVEKNYYASKSFNIHELEQGMKVCILAKINTDEGNYEPSTKNKENKEMKKSTGKKEKVSESFERLLSSKDKLTDKEIAKEMKKLHPERKPYDEDYVKKVRKLYEKQGTLLAKTKTTTKEKLKPTKVAKISVSSSAPVPKEKKEKGITIILPPKKKVIVKRTK